MAWDEWDQLKNEAAQKQATQMQLNQVDHGGGGGPLMPGGGKPDLASSPAEKKAAADAIDQHLHKDTQKAGDWADEETVAAVNEFNAKDGDGWVTSAALKNAHTGWGKQVKALRARLATESNALRNTSISFQNNDVGIAGQIRQQSTLDQYR
ncbi:hypothetical protein [Streptomyces sp. A5-4]|uniref:hypothetical protein n=1 Tax=Streptomyces sp. A5-4 TaxID=3384771 RepID=UPI003DA92CD4